MQLSPAFLGIGQDKLNRARRLNAIVAHVGRFGECRGHWTCCCCGAPAPGLLQLDAVSTLKSKVLQLPQSKGLWEVQIGEDVVFSSDGWGAQHSIFLVCTFWVRIRQELGRSVWEEPSALQQLLVLEELKELGATLHV